MSKGLKVAAWAALFLACAGVGAYIAAHSDPFPPGVDRPTGSSLASASTSPSGPPAPERWVGSFRSSTYHQLYVGGRCTTRWRGDLRFTVDPDTGAVEGTGAARLFGVLECDFPIAQTQVRRFRLQVVGHILEGGMKIRLLQASIDPRAIALPEAQWLQVCELFTSGVKDDEINGVNLGLSWMNQGPSGYTD